MDSKSHPQTRALSIIILLWVMSIVIGWMICARVCRERDEAKALKKAAEAEVTRLENELNGAAAEIQLLRSAAAEPF